MTDKEYERENERQLVKLCLNPLGLFNLKKRAEYVELVESMDRIMASLAWNGRKGWDDYSGEWYRYGVWEHDRKDPEAHAKAIDWAVDPLEGWSIEEPVFFEKALVFLDIMASLNEDAKKLRKGTLDPKKDNSKANDKEYWGD